MMKWITNKISKAEFSVRTILVFCLILIPGLLYAKEFSEQEVRAAVETWVRYVTADARPDAVIERMESHKVEGKIVAYIAHLSGGGFCLCGMDDLVLPVYLYSPEGKYDPENPGYQYILWEIETRLKELRKGVKKKLVELEPYQEALSERSVFWQELIDGRIPARVEAARAKALAEDTPFQMTLTLTCRWHQDSPYNAQCPTKNGVRCPVGCVATAMAQIMYYWKWPHRGEGSADDINFGNTTYNWRIIQDSHPTTTPGGDAEVAKLCHHVGVAVGMDYGTRGSVASSEDIDDAFEDHFRYDTDVTVRSRNINAMIEEIQWLRPIAMGGFKKDSKDSKGGKVGHEWVVFGYKKATNPQFKVNLGWGGSPDWYTCDRMGFPISQDIVIRIAPRSVVRFVGANDPGDGSPNDPYEHIEEAIDEAPDGATLIFKAGSKNTFAASTLTINRPFTLKGYNITIRKK
jgi:hypothetical protein